MLHGSPKLLHTDQIITPTHLHFLHKVPFEAFYYYYFFFCKKIVLISGPRVGGAKKIVMKRKGDGVYNRKRTAPLFSTDLTRSPLFVGG